MYVPIWHLRSNEYQNPYIALNIFTSRVLAGPTITSRLTLKSVLLFDCLIDCILNMSPLYGWKPLSANQYYIKHMSGPLTANHNMWVCRLIANHKILTTTYKQSFIESLSHVVCTSFNTFLIISFKSVAYYKL